MVGVVWPRRCCISRTVAPHCCAGHVDNAVVEFYVTPTQGGSLPEAQPAQSTQQGEGTVHGRHRFG